MSNDTTILVTLTDGTQLFKCAIKIPSEKISFDEVMYWAEPENTSKINNLLPLHVKSCGSIVNVEQIFDIVCFVGDKE